MGCFKLLVVMEKMRGGATLGNLLPALTHIFIASQEKLWQGRWQRENSTPARNTTHSNEWLAVICQTVQRVLQRVVSLFYEAASSYGDWKIFSSNEQYMPELQTKKTRWQPVQVSWTPPHFLPRVSQFVQLNAISVLFHFFFFEENHKRSTTVKRFGYFHAPLNWRTAGHPPLRARLGQCGWKCGVSHFIIYLHGWARGRERWRRRLMPHLNSGIQRSGHGVFFHFPRRTNSPQTLSCNESTLTQCRRSFDASFNQVQVWFDFLPFIDETAIIHFLSKSRCLFRR